MNKANQQQSGRAGTLGFVLRSLTVPLTDVSSSHPPSGLLAGLLTQDSLCWVRRDEGLVGIGTVAEFTVRGHDRFDEAKTWWAELASNAGIDNPVGIAGSGPAAFGSFTFSKLSKQDSTLRLPRLVVGLRDGVAWLTINSTQGEVTEQMAHEELARWRESITPHEAPEGRFEVATGALSESEWTEVVAEGIRAIKERSLEKVVLARDIVVRGSNPIDRPTVLSQLMNQYRECWTYGVGNFIGATPEMLIKVEAGVARARVLAGTVDRAGAPTSSSYAQEMLIDSPKQRQEHEIAIKSLIGQLAPFSIDLHFPAEPFILALPNVWHLASDVSAELAASNHHLPSSLALVEALHPTAAVCGTPRLEAGALIRELENFDRGPYAGPVGWLDAAGNGEWGIGLRGAVLENEYEARLYAGCGIVEASDPEAELAETWAKFRPMLQALGAQK